MIRKRAMEGRGMVKNREDRQHSFSKILDSQCYVDEKCSAVSLIMVRVRSINFMWFDSQQHNRFTPHGAWAVRGI